MSVRRLAEDTIQPAGFAFNAENAAWAKATIRKYPEGRQQSAVIPLMMRAQEQDGWVTKAAIEGIADMLDMPYIRALEVATFYTQFQLKPVGTRAHVQVCGTTPCMLRGSEELMRVCREKIHPQPFQTNEGGTLSWEEVECQGACVNAPMVMIFKDAYEDLTPERLAEIIDAFEEGEGPSVPPGPQNGRHLSAPLGALTSLTDDQAVIEGSNHTGGRRNPDTAAQAVGNPDGAPIEKGRPSKGLPPESDPQIASPANAKGPGGPSKSNDEAGGEPAGPATDGASAARPKASGRSGGKAAASAPAASAKAGARGDERAPKADDATASEAGRPRPAEKPARPDDLKLISGIGPKIEAKLNDLGVWSYAQIAGWKKAERAWVDDHLNFAGRIERDDWIKQAKALAKGGEAEYVRVFGKKPR